MPNRSDNFFTFAVRLWGVLSGLIMLVLVIATQTKEFQGYYYTFLALLMFQQVADAGFSIVLTQFASHEWAHLRRGPKGKLTGEPAALSRLASLVRIAVFYYPAVATCFFLVLGPVGYLFLSAQSATNVSWEAPWWILCALTSIALLNAPINALLEGCGQVGLSQRNQLIANITGSVVGWVLLISGAELYAIVVLVGVRAGLNLALSSFFVTPLLRLFHHRGGEKINWRNDFWPQQRRIFISWVSGLLMFESFVPIAFYFHGPVAAGQVGVMVQAYLAVNRTASAWLVGAQVRFGMLGAKKAFPELRRLVVTTIWRSLFTAAALGGIGLTMVAVIKSTMPEYGMRIGNFIPLATFVLAAILMQFSNVETTAVRFLKIEPFVSLTVFGGLLMVAGVAAAAKWFEVDHMANVFVVIIALILLPRTHVIYLKHVGARLEKS